jgi:heptaprenyl diphosphate synthase
VADAEAFALAAAGDTRQAALLSRAFGGLRAQTEPDDFRFYVQLPLLLHAALTGDPSPARPLAVATTFVYLGADMLDDLADGECSPRFAGVPESQVQLAGLSLLSVLPQLAITRLAIAPTTATAMHEALASGLLEMINGQLADLAAAGSRAVDPEDVEASVVAKSGGESAMFARLTALLAGCDPETVERCAEVGRAMGTAGQLASDCVDIGRSDPSTDLANGTRSLPIALHLNHLEGTARRRFLSLLDDSRRDPAAATTVRRELLDGGSVRACGVMAGVHAQIAERGLDSIARFEGPAAMLREWIVSLAFVRRREEASPPQPPLG